MKEKSIYFAVEKIYCILGAIYIIFMLEFSGFKSLKSLESLVSLVRLHRKVSKSRETFKVRDFVNTSQNEIGMHIVSAIFFSDEISKFCTKFGALHYEISTKMAKIGKN